MPEKYILYFDDTGSRAPDRNACIPRHDKMDCFGLGGILVKEEDIEAILQKHKSFCAGWNIDYPLHSSKIRGGQGKFGWLKKPENAGLFFPALEEFGVFRLSPRKPSFQTEAAKVATLLQLINRASAHMTQDTCGKQVLPTSSRTCK